MTESEVMAAYDEVAEQFHRLLRRSGWDGSEVSLAEHVEACKAQMAPFVEAFWERVGDVPDRVLERAMRHDTDRCIARFRARTAPVIIQKEA